MARLNDDAQWIMLMAFIICIALFFLALIINESTLVGQTTAEGVLDFSKSDIQDLRSEILRIKDVEYTHGPYDPLTINGTRNATIQDIETIGIQRKSSLMQYSIDDTTFITTIHFNNGVTQYDETL